MRAQMKMAENIIILVIFLFLLVFGLVFYVKFSMREGAGTSAYMSEQRAQQIATKVQYLPELQCTEIGKKKYNCVDMLKLDALSRIKKQKQYGKLFPNTRVTVTQVYPGMQNWTFYDEKPLFSKKEIQYYVPVALRDVRNETRNMGYLTITVYQ
jgi:hypothetical protein